jgi:hypothetical protein
LCVLDSSLDLFHSLCQKNGSMITFVWHKWLHDSIVQSKLSLFPLHIWMCQHGGNVGSITCIGHKKKGKKMGLFENQFIHRLI